MVTVTTEFVFFTLQSLQTSMNARKNTKKILKVYQNTEATMSKNFFNYTIDTLQKWRVSDSEREMLNETEDGKNALALLDKAFNGDINALDSLDEREAIMSENGNQPDIVTVAMACLNYEIANPQVTAKSTPNKRPDVLPVDFRRIPHEIATLRQWVLWRHELVKGRWSKIPKQCNGANASSTDKNTWTNLDFAVRVYQSGGYDGIGFVLKENGGYIGIDLDNCVIANAVTHEARKIISLLNSFTELSPSGHGIHIIVKGRLTHSIKSNFIEVYHGKRYLTFTGYSDGKPIIENQSGLEKVLEIARRARDGEDTQIPLF